MAFKLLESGQRKRRTPTEAAVSVAIHAGLILALVYATAQTGEITMGSAQKVQPITFAVPKAAPKAPAAAPAPKTQAPRPVMSERSTAPSAPIEEPTASDLTSALAGTGTSDSPGERGAYYDYEVGMAAAALGGGMRPRYPDVLRQSGIEGRVEVEFVVDERGRVDMRTVKVLESSHTLFTNAVRNALGGMRFSPARVNGVAVRQFVRLPVIFQLRS